MTIPLATDLFERVLTDVVARATRPERRYPLIVTTAVGVQAQETLALPRRVTVDSVPEAVSVKARDLTLAIRYSTAGSEGDAGRPVLEFNKMFLVDSRQFDPDSYMELRKVLERNAGSKRDQVTLGLHRLQ